MTFCIYYTPPTPIFLFIGFIRNSDVPSSFSFDLSSRPIQGVKKLRLQRFRDDRGGKNKHVFYLAKLWLMHRFASRWFWLPSQHAQISSVCAAVSATSRKGHHGDNEDLLR